MSDFVDEAQLCAIGGDGGAGAVSFRRESHVPRGGPDGGDGGDGGSVWLVADHQVASLLAFRDHPHRRAESGVHGSGKGRHGARGRDLRVAVPEGTVIHDPGGEVLAELSMSGDEWRAAQGGQGGKGNARFLSNRRRAPSFAEQGETGEQRWMRLELKLMADVALVGFPNAGKSTLISRISAARPKVADYPFTTLRPHLGVVRTESSEMVVADVPGLIEGASEGRGLGHQFLRHVERARVLAVLVDLSPMAELEPRRQVEVLVAELERYDAELARRPRIVVGTKADIADPRWVPGGVEPWSDMAISAVTGSGVVDLLGALHSVVAEARAQAPTRVGFVVHHPPAEGLVVTRAPDGAFEVQGRAARRVVAVNDLTDSQALDHVRRGLRRLGVDRALVRAGAQEGDEVRIGDVSFEYSPDGAPAPPTRRDRRR